MINPNVKSIFNLVFLLCILNGNRFTKNRNAVEIIKLSKLKNKLS